MNQSVIYPLKNNVKLSGMGLKGELNTTGAQEYQTLTSAPIAVVNMTTIINCQMSPNGTLTNVLENVFSKRVTPS